MGTTIALADTCLPAEKADTHCALGNGCNGLIASAPAGAGRRGQAQGQSWIPRRPLYNQSTHTERIANTRHIRTHTAACVLPGPLLRQHDLATPLTSARYPRPIPAPGRLKMLAARHGQPRAARSDPPRAEAAARAYPRPLPSPGHCPCPPSVRPYADGPRRESEGACRASRGWCWAPSATVTATATCAQGRRGTVTWASCCAPGATP